MEPSTKQPVGRRFRLVEGLAILVILVLLAALALPAILKSREGSREAMCQNNLRKLSSAIQQYHESFTMYPISMGPWDGASFSSSPEQNEGLNGKGWIVSVLPQLGEQALYDRFVSGFDGTFLGGQGFRSPAVKDALNMQLPVLQCPSDPSVREPAPEQWQWFGSPMAVTNYKGVLGDSKIGGDLSSHEGTMPDCHMFGGCNGLFYRVTFREPQSLKKVTDGISSTFLVGEDVPEHNNHSAAFYANTDYASCHAPLNFFPDPPRPDDWFDVISFRSRHPGGAHFAMVDGSVRFVSQGIEHGLYRALSTKAGGEKVSVP
jgi:prepilin-type processing-associated H-X9-DG protein